MSTLRPNVNRQIFSWAVRRAGADMGDVLKKYPKFDSWCGGETNATVAQLKDFAKKYRFPFGYFFLAEPPETKQTEIPFFRSEDNGTAFENMNINETVVMLKERQNWLSSYLAENGADKNPILGIRRNETNAETIVAAMREYLELPDGWNLRLRTPEKAISLLRDKLEERNIITTFNSVVNANTSRPVPVSLCRGFCLMDEYAPFIFVNSADSKKAQVFTILHELAHIFISFSAGFGEHGANSVQNEREALCDEAAASMLIPQDMLTSFSENHTNEEISDLFKASEIVILRRKLSCGLINKSEFFKAYNALPAIKKTGATGGNFYLIQANRISKKLIRCLNNAMLDRSITPLEAYRLAGVNGNVFAKLANGERA